MKAYLEKHRFCEKQIHDSASAGTGIIVVIPSYNEPELLKTLQSLFECERTRCVAEIIVVINSGEQKDENVLMQNQQTISEAEAWIKNISEDKLKFHVIEIKNLPRKHAGVGLARKIGMDEAVDRVDSINNDDGIIVCLDADCTVEKNYLTEIEKHFKGNPKATGCSIYFEHPLEGKDFKNEIYAGIVNYELFLRYYNRALHYCGFPYAFQTIGSCMAVRSKVYQKQGGMNRRKAGEDFYFLHKIFPLKNFTELNSTCVYPSPRESDRVPFGTGSAMQKILGNPLNPPKGDIATHNLNNYFAYNIQSFKDLKRFFEQIPRHYNLNDRKNLPALPDSIKKFLLQINFEEKLKELRKHSASEKMFVKRFFNWFNGFMVLKFVHFARDNFYPQQEIFEAATQLMQLSGKEIAGGISKKELLLTYRKWERATAF